MPAFMSTRPRAHVAARVVSDAGTTPTIRTWQHPGGQPDGESCPSASSSEHDPNHHLTSSASGRVQAQQGSCMRSTGIGLVHAAERVGKVNRIGIGVTLAGKLVIFRSRSRIWRDGIEAAHGFAETPLNRNEQLALERIKQPLN